MTAFVSHALNTASLLLSPMKGFISLNLKKANCVKDMIKISFKRLSWLLWVKPIWNFQFFMTVAYKSSWTQTIIHVIMAFRIVLVCLLSKEKITRRIPPGSNRTISVDSLQHHYVTQPCPHLSRAEYPADTTWINCSFGLLCLN